MDVKKLYLEAVARVPLLAGVWVKVALAGLVCLAIGGAGGWLTHAGLTTEAPAVVSQCPEVIEEEVPPCEVRVDIDGAVVKPGVYCLKSGAIVEEALIEAGGLGPKVCSAWAVRELNRALVVEANSKIFIPSKSDGECGSAGGAVAGSASGGSAVAVGMCAGGKVSINKASPSQLETLSGVGPATSQKIIDGRPYKKMEDLMNVKGIGDATFEKLKDKICL